VIVRRGEWVRRFQRFEASGRNIAHALAQRCGDRIALVTHTVLPGVAAIGVVDRDLHVLGQDRVCYGVRSAMRWRRYE